MLDRDYYTIAEVAELFRITEYTARKWGREKKYGAIKRGRKWLFPKEKIL